jgi:hypothetical protein
MKKGRGRSRRRLRSRIITERKILEKKIIANTVFTSVLKDPTTPQTLTSS